MMRSICFAVVFGALTFVGVAHGQPAEGCTNLNSTEGPKVVLGRVELESPTGTSEVITETEKISIFLELQGRLDLLFGKPGAISAILCAAHDPEVDGSTFTEQYVEALDAEDVLMEVWGRLRSTATDGVTLTRAELCMAVFPVRLQPLEGVDPSPFHHVLLYPSRDLGSDAVAVLNQTALGKEFDVYALLAQAIKSFRNRNWDEAQRLLETARLVFEDARANDLLAQSTTNLSSVAGYLEKLQEKIISGAASDPEYDGDVALLDQALGGTP